MEIFILMALVVLIVVVVATLSFTIMAYNAVQKRQETHLVIDEEVDRRLSMLMQDISKDITEGYVEKLGKQLKFNPELFAKVQDFAAEREAATILMLLDNVRVDIGRAANGASAARAAAAMTPDESIRDQCLALAEKNDAEVEKGFVQLSACLDRLANVSARRAAQEQAQL